MKKVFIIAALPEKPNKNPTGRAKQKSRQLETTSMLTQKLKGEFSNVLLLLKLDLAVAHVLKDTSQRLVVVVGVGDVGQSLGVVSLAIRSQVGLTVGDVSLENYQL